MRRVGDRFEEAAAPRVGHTLVCTRSSTTAAAYGAPGRRQDVPVLPPRDRAETGRADPAGCIVMIHGCSNEHLSTLASLSRPFCAVFMVYNTVLGGEEPYRMRRRIVGIRKRAPFGALF